MTDKEKRASYTKDKVNRILVLAFRGTSLANSLEFCQLIAPEGRVHVLGIVSVPDGEMLSHGTGHAMRMRKEFKQIPSHRFSKISSSVHACHAPTDKLLEEVGKRSPDLIIIDCTDFPSISSPIISEILRQPPCDLAILKGSLEPWNRRVLVPVRGGPHSELALRLALQTQSYAHNQITALLPKSDEQTQSLSAISNGLKNIKNVEQRRLHSSHPREEILDIAKEHDIVFLGFSRLLPDEPPVLGAIAQSVVDQAERPVIIVKTRRELPDEFNLESSGQEAISVVVDSWFARNTYHSSEFADIAKLIDLKNKSRERISVVLPTLNEEATIGPILKCIQRNLMGEFPLVDEAVVIDSGSSDKTREIAQDLGAPVFVHQELLPAYGARKGKGEALWKSLLATSGDIIIFVDTDIVNFHQRFVSGQVGALLSDPSIQFVKGFYRRPLRVDGRLQAGGGGRVTELTARPLINLFVPELSGVVQPLSGEYGGRRGLLERLPFYSGYGVEIGLLIDALHHCGLDGIAQVDLLERIHHNQDLSALSKMSFLILQAVMDKVSQQRGVKMVEDFDRSMKMVQYSPGRLFLSIEEVVERVRPPMLEIPEYVESRKCRLSA
jgi:nucleotide-binding universal stress UspA family protein